MHCHLPANHWLVGLHRVLSRNAERLVVVMVTLQVINDSVVSSLFKVACNSLHPFSLKEYLSVVKLFKIVGNLVFNVLVHEIHILP